MKLRNCLMKKSLLFIIVVSLLLACAHEDNGSTTICSSVTVGTEKVTAISAVLLGKAILGSTLASDLQIGFQYSTSAGILPSNSTTVEAVDADTEYNYSYRITGLEPSTTYYFRSFVRQNGQDNYGEIKEFATKGIESLIETEDAQNIGATSATLNAKLNISDISYGNLSYGFYWGAYESSQNEFIKGGDLSETLYSSKLDNLSHKTQFWYKACVTIDGQILYGSLKNFTTGVIPVESVSLDKNELTLSTIGTTRVLNATVLPINATDRRLKWSSDKENVASVNANGRVTANGNGKATITVTTIDQGKKATCEITVAQLITGISLNKTSVSLNEGAQESLIATITPSNAANKTLIWTSSDNSVATVDQNGKVTAVSKGSATIRVETTDGSLRYATCAVSVIKQITSIELNPTSMILYLSGGHLSESIIATVSPSDATNMSIEWKSSNTSVATVSNGLVTGKAVGATTITAKAKDGSGVKATCEVVVRNEVPFFFPSTTFLIVGPKAKDTRFSIDASDYLEWTVSSSNPDFVLSRVSGKGSANINISFTENSLTEPRSAIVTISTMDEDVETKSWTITIIQGPASDGDIEDGTPGYNDHLISRRKFKRICK